ncbi:hypothetical protein CRUP_037708 [Coryphaenoides rupestris]|nr:hypothetical protein CRUP_037708 [Coryphaenoides rupestris]
MDGCRGLLSPSQDKPPSILAVSARENVRSVEYMRCATPHYMTAPAAAAPMQGTYIPQYTAVPPAAVPVESVVTDASPQTVAPSSQEVAAQQQQIQVDGGNDHVPAYSYQK